MERYKMYKSIKENFFQTKECMKMLGSGQWLKKMLKKRSDLLKNCSKPLERIFSDRGMSENARVWLLEPTNFKKI